MRDTTPEIETQRIRRVDATAAVFALACLALATYPGVLRGGVLLPTDWLYEAYYPWRAMDPGVVSVNPRQNDAIVQLHPLDRFTRERLLSGQIPLWNPLLGAGVPHLATGVTRALYPPFWLTLPLGAEAGRNLEVLHHLVMAAVFQSLYLRFMGCHWAAALIGGMAFGWSGALTVRTPLNYIFDTLAWLPAVLLGAEMVLRGRPRGVPALALAAGMQLLAGSLPDVLSTWILVAAYVLVRSAGGPRPRPRAVALLLGAIVLAAGLAAAQLLPHLELVSLSQRGRRTYEELRGAGTLWESLLSLLSPSLVGGEFSRVPPLGGAGRVVPLYVGAIPLMLIPAGLRAGRSAAIALAAAGGLVFLIAAGTPLLYVLYVVFPPVAGLRYVHTLGHVCALALAGLAGWGADAWLRERAGAAPGRRPAVWTTVTAMLVAGLGATLTIAAVRAGDPRVADAYQEVARGLAFVAAGLLALVARRRALISVRGLAAALVLLCAAELREIPARHNPVISQTRHPVLPPNPAFQVAMSDPEPVRAIGVQPKESGRFGPWVIGSNLFQAYGISDAGAYHSLLPARLVRYHAVMERLSEGAPADEALAGGRPFFVGLEHYDFRPTSLIRLMNVRYLFYLPTGRPPNRAELRVVHAGHARVYRFTEHLPRAFVVGEFEVVPDPERLLARLADPGFEPRRTVLLEDPPPVGRLFGSGDESSVSLSINEPERSAYEVRSPRGGLLVVTDSMYPGWSARVNGTAVVLLRADYLFRAVAVPAGSSGVELRYHPRSFQIGGILSALSGALIFGLWVAAPRRAVRRPPRWDHGFGNWRATT